MGIGLRRVAEKLIFATFTILAVSGRAEAISLKEAVEKAITERPEVAIAVKEANIDADKVDEAYGSLFPTVDLDADYRRQMVDQPEVKLPDENRVWRNGHQATVIGRLVLFNGLQRANTIYRNEARLDASSYLVVESAEALALQVVEAYIDHRRHTFLLKIADDNIATHRRLLRLVKERVEGGRSSQSAVEQVEERLYGAEVIRAEVLQQLLENNAKFKALVGMEPHNTRPVKFPSEFPQNANFAMDLARQYNPTISALMLEVEARDYDVDRVIGEMAPTISVEGRAQYGDDINGDPGRNDDFSVQLRLNWQLFDGGQKLARTREATERAGIAYLERDLSIRRIQERLDAAYGKLAAIQQRLTAADNQTKAARQLVTSYQAEYEANRVSIIELLDAERSVAASRFEYVSVSGVKLFTGYTVKALTGTLLKSLGINKDFAVTKTPMFSGLPGVRSSDFSIEPLQ
jgi:adhesin transport system outer membrane protein